MGEIMAWIVLIGIVIALVPIADAIMFWRRIKRYEKELRNYESRAVIRDAPDHPRGIFGGNPYDQERDW